MPSFRKPENQARHAAGRMAAHGASRAETRGSAWISSVGTERSYQQSLARFAAHLQAERAGDLRTATPAQARKWLGRRAEEVSQTTLDRDRQALAAFFASRGEDLGARRADFRARAEPGGLATTSRRYTDDQLDRIQRRQAPHHGLATRLAREAGLRAQELATLARPEDRPATADRPWRPDRGGQRVGTVVFTVQGKGGLVREVFLSRPTAARLEAVRREEPITVRDRGVRYISYYAIGYGQAWSQSFSQASREELGWSLGAHACRHVYAQDRMDQLQQAGYRYEEAKEVVAQELGHFRAETTEAYLR